MRKMEAFSSHILLVSRCRHDSIDNNREAPEPRTRGEKTHARPYHHGNLRACLLEAAEAVLAERGAHGLTLQDGPGGGPGSRTARPTTISPA